VKQEDDMKSITTAALALLLVAAAGASAAEPTACANDPGARGIRERMAALHDDMSRIEFTVDGAEQRVLMDLHRKKMHEAMRTLRERGAGEACRVEFMQAMMEQMMRHELALRDER
jgi:hypothetical protein